MLKKKYISEIINDKGVTVYESPLCDTKKESKLSAIYALKDLEEDYYAIETTKLYILVKKKEL